MSKKKIEERILERSVKNKLDAGEEVVVSGDQIIHRRTAEEYSMLWNKFLLEEEADFIKMFEYGKDAILRIGINKFIDAMDWVKEEDVAKWRTDSFNVVICPECDNDFGIYQKMGLCPNCLKKFDQTKIGALMNIVAMHSEILPGIINQSMYLIPELRKDFKHQERRS